MKKSFLPLGILVAACTLVITLFNSPVLNYTPIDNRVEMQKTGIDVAQSFMQDRKANQKTGKVDYQDVQKARDQVALHTAMRSSASALEWEEMGPDNVGGRTRAVLIDKDNPSRIYAGAVSGGLWISESGGRAWRKYSDELENLNISCITQAPNGDIYFGTGEVYFVRYGSDGDGGSGFLGNGVWKKEFTSSEFIHLPSTDMGNINNDSDFDWSNVNELAVDPFNANRVYAATSGGFKISDDGGSTWTSATEPRLGVNAIDVQLANDGSYVMAVGGPFGGNKIFMSSTGDPGSFIEMHNFDASANVGSQVGRIEVAISSNPDILYCAISDNGGNGNMKGIFRSDDRAQSWEMIAYPDMTELDIFTTQARYAMLLAVHPTNPDKLYAGGLDLWTWEKDKNWEKLTQWFYSFFPTFTDYLHADQHTMVFNPTNPDVLYVGNDGGVFRSEDGGSSFKAMNRGYNVTQFYALGFSPYGEVMGGTQDNGTQMMGWKSEYSNSDIVQGATPTAGMKVKGGDGGFAEFSRIDPDILFVESQYTTGTDVHGWLQRSRDKGLSLEYQDNDRFFLDAFIENDIEANGAPFITSFSLWEEPNDMHSRDSVTFVNSITSMGVGAGDGISTSFTGTLETEQSAAEIDYNSVRYYSGEMEILGANAAYWSLSFDTAGNPIDSVFVTSTTNTTTGEFTIDFGQPAALNLPVLAGFETNYSAGDVLNVQSATLDLPLTHTLTQDLVSGDSVKIQDPVQSKFFLGANSGVWMTRDPLDLSEESTWMQIGDTPGTKRDIDWSSDGNYCFIVNNNSVYRVSRLRYADDKAHGDVGGAYYLLDQKQLAAANGLPSGQAATGVYVDKRDANRVVVTYGNYGNSTYVYASTNALSNNPDFISIQGDLPAMPVYDAIINAADSSQIFLATEYGVWSTSLIYNNLPSPITQQDPFEYIREKQVEKYTTLSSTFSIDTTQGYNIFDIDLSNITDIDTFLQTPLNVLQYNIDTTILVTLTDTIVFNGNEFVWSVDTNVNIVDSVVSVTGTIPSYSFSCFKDTTLFRVDTSMVLDWDTLQIVDNVTITQNITTQNPTWIPEDMGLGNVPTFGIKQQYYAGENFGQIYVATHGRGMFKSGSFVPRNDDIVEEESEETDLEVLASSMNIYPNPFSNQLTIDFVSDVNEENIRISIYDLTGKVLLQTQTDVVEGSNKIPMDVSTLPKGTYLVRFDNENDSQYAKIIKAY